MIKVIITIGLAVLLVNGSANAVGSKYFYSDGNIVTGDYWSSAYIYDTPPNHTTLNMSGGQVGSMSTFNSSVSNITNGTISLMVSYDTSKLNITGGTMDNLLSLGSSIANISGGGPSDISDRDHSVTNFSGTAEAINVNALDSATINITGGTINDLSAYNSGVINIYAGDIFDVWGQDNTAVNIFGHNLIKTSIGGAYGHGFVKGIYNNQTSFEIDFMGSDTYSHVNLIPEPITILLLGAGGLFLRKKD
jgi:hypothetical protein